MHVRLLQLLRKASLIRVCAVCRASYIFLTYTYYKLENSTPLHCDIYNMHWSISEQYLGWSGGAMVLGKLPVRGRPTNLDNNGARAYCACNRCGRGLFGHFFLSCIPISPLSPSLWKSARYRLEYCLKGPFNPKQPTNRAITGNSTGYSKMQYISSSAQIYPRNYTLRAQQMQFVRLFTIIPGITDSWK